MSEFSLRNEDSGCHVVGCSRNSELGRVLQSTERRSVPRDGLTENTGLDNDGESLRNARMCAALEQKLYRRTVQTVSDLFSKRICSLDTSASIALGVL